MFAQSAFAAGGMSLESARSGDWRTLGTALFSDRLLVRPSVLPDESFPGYRMRVAFANGLSDPGWLDCVVHSLPKTHGVARWCPHCLANPGCYWREDWYSGPAACLVHRCWLTSACNACQRTLRWKHVRFFTCTCGASLRDALVDRFSADVLKLLAEQATSNGGLPSVLERWNLARFLGALSQFGLHGKPLKKASRQKENIEQLVVTCGASLMADQLACFELLDRLRAPVASANNVPLLSEAFPHLLVMLRKQLNETERQWVMVLLDAYVASSSRRGSALIWERKGSNQRTSTEFCRQKTRSPAIVTMLAQTGTAVPVRRTLTGRKKFVISQADLQDLWKAQRSLIAAKTAARYAGISVNRIHVLAKAGLIASTGKRVDMRSVDLLLRKIVAACACDVPVFEDPVSLTEALRRYVPVEATGAFFNRLMSGAVPLFVEPGKVPALRNIVVNRGEVVPAVQALAASGSLISIVEAAHRLGVKQEVMYHLVNIGLVRTRTGKQRRRTTRVVDVNDLQEFTEQFLPLFTVAKAMGISARGAPGWARQHGIEIVTGPSVDGGRQYWIRRQAWKFPAA